MTGHGDDDRTGGVGGGRTGGRWQSRGTMIKPEDDGRAGGL